MLAGEPPHIGGSAQQIIMKIIAEPPPPVTTLRKSVPPNVAAAVAKALEKLPADRFTSAAEFSAALEGRVTSRKTGASTQSAAGDGKWRRIAIGAGSAAAFFALLAAIAWMGRGKPLANSDRVEIAMRMSSGMSERTRVTISPDGRRVLQSGLDSNGTYRLLVRELGSTAITTIPQTEDATDPIYSPDGQWIAFLSEGKLRKMPAAGGPSTVLADSVNAGAHWAVDGWIAYTRSGAGLWRVRESGGPPERLTTLDTARHEFNHWYPQILPGGRAAIFNSFTTPFARSRIEAVEFVRRADGPVEGAIFARYVESGHLLYARDGAIFAVPFDPKRLRLLGTAVPVVELTWTPTDGTAGFEVSPTGTLVYLKGSEWRVDRRLVWWDRSGNERPAVPEPGAYAEPRLSPDGRWIAITRLLPSWQIWLIDRNRQCRRS